MSLARNPTSLAALLELEAVPQHRCLSCPEYDDCLEIAASAGWTSWSCENCPLARSAATLREALFVMHGPVPA
jgi:hypothetical protein